MSEDFNKLKPFRFWCQKVLPLVYDNSLSYYELLCKVVDYLNKTMEDVNSVIDLTETFTEEQSAAYAAFTDNINATVASLTESFNTLQSFVDNYFNNLDVQEEIDNKLDLMASDGTLSAMVRPVAAAMIPSLVAQWLEDNITPTTPAVDKTLAITGAAADARETGYRLAWFGDSYAWTDNSYYALVGSSAGQPVSDDTYARTARVKGTIDEIIGVRSFPSVPGGSAVLLWRDNVYVGFFIYDSTGGTAGYHYLTPDGTLTTAIPHDEYAINWRKNTDYPNWDWVMRRAKLAADVTALKDDVQPLTQTFKFEKLNSGGRLLQIVVSIGDVFKVTNNTSSNLVIRFRDTEAGENKQVSSVLPNSTDYITATVTAAWIQVYFQSAGTATIVKGQIVDAENQINLVSDKVDNNTEFLETLINTKIVKVKFEKGKFAPYTSANRYNASLAETKNYMLNAYPIIVDGATKVIFPAITLTDATTYNIYWRDSAGANVATNILTCAVDNNTVDVPAGAYYLDILIKYSGLYDLPVKIIGGNDKTGKQQKRIYTKNSGEQVCFFEVNQLKDVYSACCFMLPPNYNATGEKIPLVLWFDGNMNYRTLASTFTTSKLPGLQYIRDEGFAVLQIYSWGSYFATKYAHCGDDQPYPSPTCVKVIETGLKWFCNRYNIDSENIHIVSKSMGGLISLFFASHPIVPFRSVSMFSPIIDMFGLRGRYSDARKAIFEDNALIGDIDDFSDINTDGSTSTGVENYYFSDRCLPIWEANKGATARLNSAYANLVGATFAENLAKSVADSRAWYADNDATGIYNHPEYKKISTIPCKIWGATHDPDVQYKAMLQVIEQMRNSGCDAEIKSVNSYDHSRFDVNTTDAQTITTKLGIICENVPIGWIESMQWIRSHSVKY